MIVLDASAAIELLLRTSTGSRVEARVFAPGVSLHAPHLIDVEVAQVLRRYVAAGAIAPSRGNDALQDLRDISLIRYPHDVLLERIWQLRGNLTAYDAAYVALAEALDAPLLTCDRKLKSPASHRARVEVI
ncbi:MAG: type II toxin-antitoxin system VapC family toxin [Candidatus Binataceae bacterium]